MRESSAAGVPIFILLAFAAVEAIASRTWAVVLIGFAGVAMLALVIWHSWPKEDERETIRGILSEHPEFDCPMCGETGKHNRTCPVSLERSDLAFALSESSSIMRDRKRGNPMNKPGGTCTDTDEPIQPAGTLAGVAQCASCYLEGRSEPCATWSHYRELG